MGSRHPFIQTRKNNAGVAYYAVANGRNIGVYKNWSECKKEVMNFPKARFKKFSSVEEAERFIDDYKQSTEISQSRKRKRDDDSECSPESPKKSFNSGLKHAIVYTDGACSNNGHLGAKAGIGVYWGKNDEKNVSAPLSGRATNNRAEIHAAITAIKQAKEFGYESVSVRTDSNFLINSVNSWLKKWIRNGWKLSNGSDVVNKEDFQELHSAMNGIEVIWEKVYAHSGIAGNEAADKLAVQGAKS